MDYNSGIDNIMGCVRSLTSQVPKGMEAVYMRISRARKVKWRQLAIEHRTDMTNYFVKWLDKQKVRAK